MVEHVLCIFVVASGQGNVLLLMLAAPGMMEEKGFTTLLEDGALNFHSGMLTGSMMAGVA